jgi:HlyD family secretion protein
MKKFIVLIVILVLAAVGAGWWFMSGKANGKRVFVTDKITRGTISNTISSSGSLAALNTVEIGSQVSGQITKLYVDFNDEVQAGQLIAELDPASFEAQVLQAQANLESSRASLHGVEAQIKNLQASMLTTMADIKASEANVRKSEVALKDAERNYNRIKELHNRKLISASDLDNAETNLESKSFVRYSKSQFGIIKGAQTKYIGADGRFRGRQKRRRSAS